MKSLLVLDVSNLCHRAWHALPKLSWRGQSTEVIFGFLRTVEHLRNHFATDNFAFCFEHPILFRRDTFPEYKLRREKNPDSSELPREQLYQQISDLRLKHLPNAGFRNIFCSKGMEADDLMAMIALSRAHIAGLETILVSSDSDLYQCLLNPTVIIYSLHDKKIKTQEWFQKKYGIHPSRWAMVKSLAGCPTDGVPGISGVGEKTALKYVADALPTSSKGFQRIRSTVGRSVLDRNRQLVTLPHRLCPIPNLVDNGWNLSQWREVLNSLGIRK